MKCMKDIEKQRSGINDVKYKVSKSHLINLLYKEENHLVNISRVGNKLAGPHLPETPLLGGSPSHFLMNCAKVKTNLIE